MSGDHDHDEYVREEESDGRFDDVDAALDAFQSAIQELLQVCRTLLASSAILDRLDLEGRLDKVEGLVGKSKPPPEGPA